MYTKVPHRFTIENIKITPVLIKQSILNSVVMHNSHLTICLYTAS